MSTTHDADDDTIRDCLQSMFEWGNTAAEEATPDGPERPPALFGEVIHSCGRKECYVEPNWMDDTGAKPDEWLKSTVFIEFDERGDIA